MLRAAGYEIALYQILPDRQEMIEQTLSAWVDDQGLDLIVTTGGTGVSPSDRTPEATRAVIDREVPGLGEAMRLASLQQTVQAVWSRGIAGIRKDCLILNLPGSRKAAEENLNAVLPAMMHGLEKLKGSEVDCGQT
jgi:molybdenum cofactor synthesis domain-containing protein